METDATQDQTREDRRAPVGSAILATMLGALAAGMVAGALLGSQTTSLILTVWSCPVGDGWGSCTLPSLELLGDRLWTGIAVFLVVLATAAAIASIGGLLERMGARPATPDGTAREHLPPVLTATVALFAALAAGIAAAVLLGTSRTFLISHSCPIGNPPPPCQPVSPWIMHDPNLAAALLAFVLVLTVGTGLAVLERRS